MSLSLNDPMDVAQLAARGVHLRETVSVGQMSRLVEALPEGNATTQVTCDLRCDVDQAGRVLIRGSLATRWALECQRCLETLAQDIEIDVHWRSGELPDGDFELGDAPVRLLDWAEDELLLHLPGVPVHERLEDCAPWAKQHLRPVQPEVTAKTPFAGLKELLDKPND